MNEYGKNITIIIPVYNVEKYLDKCVSSVVNQTYKDLEIILVDDGSQDMCPKMCDDWAKKDNRIRVIHKTNGGLSDARNAGIEVANGSYIMFVDSDDYISLSAVEVLYKCMLEDGVDIVSATMESVDENGRLKPMYDVESEKVICNGTEALYKVFMGKSAVGAPNRLYKAEIVRNHLFKVGVLHEDVYFAVDVFTSCSSIKVAFLPFVGYYYFERSDSIMGNALRKSPRPDLILSYQYLFNSVDGLCMTNEKRENVKIRGTYWLSSFSLIPQYSSSKEYDDCLRIFLRENWDSISSWQFSGHYKLRLKLFYYFPKTYRRLKGLICK